MTEQVKNWEEYKASMLDGLNPKQAEYVGTLLENVHNENIRCLNSNDEGNKVLVESTAPGSTVTSNISRYDTIFAPLVRRTMPALLAMDLVGNQPLNAPRGIVRTMKFRYSETTEEGGTPVVTAGDEASGVNVYDKYSFLALGGDYDDVDNLDPFAQTVYLEGNRGKPMDLVVLTQPVETYGRKLSASYSLESADDLNALDGLDMESELSVGLGDEILRELDRELLDELNGLAGTIDSFDFALVDGRYAGERLAALSIAIDNLSAQIAQKTKKGGATWMVVSQRVLTGLKHASNGAFVPATAGDMEYRASLFAGTFGGRIRVYVDPYAITDTVLLGYKGTEFDAPLIYLPFLPLSSSGLLRNPETGDHRILMRTRYALHSFTDDNVSLGNSPDYLARATVSNINLGFIN